MEGLELRLWTHAQHPLFYTTLPLVGETEQSNSKGVVSQAVGSEKVPGHKDAHEDTETGAAWQPGRLSEEVRFGLGLKNKDLYKGRCMRGTQLHRCTDMAGFIYVYLLYSPLLKLIHTNVYMGIRSINIIVQ